MTYARKVRNAAARVQLLRQWEVPPERILAWLRKRELSPVDVFREASIARSVRREAA